MKTLLRALALLVLAATALHAQTIPNPSFETSGLANWATTGSVSVVTVVDNGAIPEGTHVAALSCPGPATQAKISTMISGLVVGGRYRVSCRVNAQQSLAPVGAGLTVQGSVLATQQQTAVEGSNPYAVLSGSFTAMSTTAALEVSANSVFSAGTLLVDDFRIARTEVLNANDSGSGSLRQVLADVAVVAGPDTVTFATSLAGQTILLASTITIQDAGGVTIDATGVPGIVINDGLNETYGLFGVGAGRNVTFRGLTLANGGGANVSTGGAISSFGFLTLERCTLSGNSAGGSGTFGGAISSSGALALTHCTLSGNSTSGDGGAIFSTGTLTLAHCTLSNNSAGNGGAIYRSGGTLTLNNCIVAGNTDSASGTDTDNISGTYTVSNNLTSGDPKLAPLADNGGPTKTMALLPGSPALDAGEIIEGLDFDQRGITARNVDGDGDGTATPDIGAYEAQAPPAASLGFNFVGGVNGNPTSPGGVMDPNYLAGVPAFAQAYWNNLTTDSDGSNTGTAPNGPTTRLDSTNTAVPGLKLWWDAPNVWAVNNTLGITTDEVLMNGYLDSNGSGDGSAATDLYASSAAQPFFSLAGLPAALTRGGYRVLVYADGGSTGGVTASYWLTSNDSQNPVSVSGERRLTPSVFLSDTANFSGTYTRATGTSTGTATAGANYVQFDHQSDSAFTVRAEEHSFRAAINAVQIVPNMRIAVTTAADELDPPGTLGTGVSLREAVRDAPDGAGIVFDSALSGQTILLSNALGSLVLTKYVTIDASGLASAPLLFSAADRIFTVVQENTVTLVGLRLQGATYSKGGAILNEGTLTVRNCEFLNCKALFTGTLLTGLGGAIYNDGMLTVTGCTFSGNSTDRDTGVSTPIFDATTGSGGAIYNPAGRTLVVTHSTFSNNTSLLDGGAIASRGTVAVTHCTFAGNTATIGGNGGGIAIRDGTLSLGYSIVAGNTAGSGGPDLYRHPSSAAVITPVGTNLIGKNNTVMAEFPQGPLVGIDASPVIANLSALDNNGGPTQTMVPLPGSPAIDAATGSTTATDQRGNARPTDGDGNGSLVADLGAVERGTFVPPISLAVTTTANSGTGSLRQAIANAAGEPGEVITFADGFSGPIVLAREITVAKAITIDARNVTAGLVLSGGGTNRIFYVDGGGNLTLKGLTLTSENGEGTGSEFGGAIRNLGTLTLTQCTLSGNSASFGGAIYNDRGTLTLTQCTLAGNAAAVGGGAVFKNGGSVTLTQCTLSGNFAGHYGGAIENRGLLTLSLTNTIVAGNSATNGPDIALNGGAITPTGKNLIGNLSGSGLSPGLTVIEGAANLAPLGNYGGRTPTMLPLAGSPAIDAGDNAAATGLTTDQRGSALPFNGTVDIGAVERGFVVTNTNNDSSTGSLRHAVTNAGTGGMVINFDPALNGQTIHLTSNNSHFNLDKNLEINAGGLPDGITIDGGSSLKTRLFVVTGGKTVALHHLKLINGGDSGFNDFGGAILNEGNLTLTNCTLSGNEVDSGNSGGAISSSLGSTLSLTDCTLSNNTADHGGGIVTVGTATLNRCTLNGNTARNGHGGAINGTSSTVTLTQCTVAGNTATGTSANNGHGGGIFCASSYLTMLHCTIAGNTANGFGGNGSGGGVFADGNFTGGFAIANTILADNTKGASGTGTDFYEAGNTGVRFTGRVFIETLGGNGFTSGGNVITGNAMLSLLGSYGGPTQTMVPLNGSPVRDQAGITTNVGSALGVNFTTDQRGLPRAVDGDAFAGAVADLGAAEAGTISLTNLALSAGTLTPAFAPATTSYTASVYASAGSVTVTPTADVGTITVNGTTVASGEASSAIALNVGENTITTVVTGVDGATQTYTVTVTLITFSVTATGDSGPGSLRQAVLDAAAHAGPDTITFPTGFTGPIVLAGEISIGSEVTIDASNVPGVTINGGSGTNRIFHVNSGGNLTLTGLTLTGGNGTGTNANDNGYGGAIHNNGTLTLTQCTLSGNSASSDGGAIYNLGTMTLTQCTLSANSAGRDGGAILNSNGNTPALVHCTLSANSASGFGGAIAIRGPFTLTNTIVAGNTAARGPDTVLLNVLFSGFFATGRNLIGDLSDSGLYANGTTVITGAANLAPLGNYGGPTPTMPPLAGSLVIDAGDNAAIPAGVTTDQRGAPLPLGTSVDIGAVESSILAPSPVNNALAPRQPTLTWTGPAGATFALFLGTDANALPSVATGLTTASYAAPALTLGTPSYWRVDATIGGVTFTGPVFTFTPVLLVTNTNNSGAGSLRQAIADAAALAGADTILFDPAVFNGEPGDTITLTSELTPGSTDLVTVDASAIAGGVTLSGGNTNRLFSVAATHSLALRSLTLTGGNGIGAAPNGNGGAIVNAGSLTADRCTFTTNGVTGGGNGGAIRNVGTLTLTNCTLSANTAGAAGGAVMSDAGSIATFTRCTFSGNTANATNTGGGAINHTATATSLTLTHCTLTANNATGGSSSGGGGIRVRGSGFTLSHCLMGGNLCASGTGPDLNTTVGMTATGANIVQTAIAGGGTVNGGGTIAQVNPLLAPLLNYGGPTQTHALASGSPARNAAIGSTVTPGSTDQRGFPIVGTPDIGAYEAGTFNSYDIWINESLPAVATAPQRATTFDFDGDGQTNEAEWTALTNPGSASSRFAATPVRNGANLEITVPTASGRSYTLMQSTTLLGGSWMPVTGFTTQSGTGMPMTFQISISGTRMFYNVQVVGP